MQKAPPVTRKERVRDGRQAGGRGTEGAAWPALGHVRRQDHGPLSRAGRLPTAGPGLRLGAQGADWVPETSSGHSCSARRRGWGPRAGEAGAPGLGTPSDPRRVVVRSQRVCVCERSAWDLTHRSCHRCHCQDQEPPRQGAPRQKPPAAPRSILPSDILSTNVRMQGGVARAGPGCRPSPPTGRGRNTPSKETQRPLPQGEGLDVAPTGTRTGGCGRAVAECRLVTGAGRHGRSFWETVS